MSSEITSISFPFLSKKSILLKASTTCKNDEAHFFFVFFEFVYMVIFSFSMRNTFYSDFFFVWWGFFLVRHISFDDEIIFMVKVNGFFFWVYVWSKLFWSIFLKRVRLLLCLSLSVLNEFWRPHAKKSFLVIFSFFN